MTETKDHNCSISDNFLLFHIIFKMKIFKALIFANALSVNANAINHREKRFISDVLQGLGSGMVNLGQVLDQSWSQVIESSIQDVVDGVGTMSK